MEIAARHGWIRPSVYQTVQRDYPCGGTGIAQMPRQLGHPFPCLQSAGRRGFSKSFGAGGAVAPGSRFDSSTVQGKLYRDRYRNDAYLDALAEIHRSCERHGFDGVSVAWRWLVHHSQLNAERNDGVIIGASSLEHLRHNLTAVTEGPLPTEVLAAIDDAALKAQPKWPPYFYGV